VNLSSRQFRDPGLVQLIAGALRANGLVPSTLTLEITETALLVRSPETLERVAELRALGVRLSIDDFGTGFSSLGYLRSFDVDELKIDRSFVSDPGRSDAQVLSRAIVELGRGLSLELVAEGIETPEQAAYFHSIGCRYGQGYLYAHPMPATEVDRYLRRQRSVVGALGALGVAEGVAPHGDTSGGVISLAGAEQKSA
jgi:EAL domain-containing protein (putative c-di-GMP-specific phosphodiesterase class I)